MREDELDSVRRFLDGVRKLGGELPSPTDYLLVGDPVTAVDGPFAGLRGTLPEERGRTRAARGLPAIRQR